MNLPDLQRLVASLNSLAEIEKQNPEIAAQLIVFVQEIRATTFDAYRAISDALVLVLELPVQLSIEQIERVAEKVKMTRGWQERDWEQRLTETCERLQLLLQGAIDKPKSSTRGSALLASISLREMMILLRHGPDVVRGSTDEAMYKLYGLLGDAKTTGTSADIKKYAFEVQTRIKTGLVQITDAVSQIEGSSSDGAERLLRPVDIAERELQSPERMLILSMFFVVLVFSLGAFAFQYLKFYQFTLVTGFALTAVIVVNAFYLRTIDKLSEESFLKLMELALLKFFAPLTRRNRESSGNPTPAKRRNSSKKVAG